MKIDSGILIGVYRMCKDLDRETAAICAAHGLTYPQFQVLEALMHKGSLTVGQIKSAILGSSGTTPVIVDNLCKKGLARRVKDPADLRKSIVELTDEGRVLIERVYPENERMFTEKFGIWTDEEKRELLRLIGRYRHAFGEPTDG